MLKLDLFLFLKLKFNLGFLMELGKLLLKLKILVLEELLNLDDEN